MQHLTFSVKKLIKEFQKLRVLDTVEQRAIKIEEKIERLQTYLFSL